MLVVTIRRFPAAFFFCFCLTCNHSAEAAKSDQQQRISFRTVKPIAAHFKSEEAAAATEKTLRQLGCTAKRQTHDGHVDVTFDCRLWKSLTVKDPHERDRWDRWLTEKGFAVVHHVPAEDHQEAVRYRLTEWRTHHFHEPLVSEAHVAMFKMLGCEVKVSRHDGHDDVAVRCSGWQTIGLPSHQEAHAWMKVLKELGFVVLHEH